MYVTFAMRIAYPLPDPVTSPRRPLGTVGFLEIRTDRARKIAHLDILIGPEFHQAFLLTPFPAGIFAAMTRMVQSAGHVENSVYNPLLVEDERVCFPYAKNRDILLADEGVGDGLGIAETKINDFPLRGE